MRLQFDFPGIFGLLGGLSDVKVQHVIMMLFYPQLTTLNDLNYSEQHNVWVE